MRVSQSALPLTATTVVISPKKKSSLASPSSTTCAPPTLNQNQHPKDSPINANRRRRSSRPHA